MGKHFPLRTRLPYVQLPHEIELSEKLKAWEFIDPSKYKYHGRWERNFNVDDVHFRYEFIEFDDEVAKAFKVKETGHKFGI